jgi:hypothetical protein
LVAYLAVKMAEKSVVCLADLMVVLLVLQTVDQKVVWKVA